MTITDHRRAEVTMRDPSMPAAPRTRSAALALKRMTWPVAGALLLSAGFMSQRLPASSEGPLADFVEPHFPFITTTVDARDLGDGFPERNVATRGVAILLGNDTYAAFDPDLLRMAVGWSGEFVDMTTMAQISYQDAFNKNNQIPKVRGTPVFTTGIYPGWWSGAPDFQDPREPGPNPADPGRGPIPTELGRWNGLYVHGDRVVLSYETHGTQIYEQPGSVAVDGDVGIVRAFRTGPVATPLTLVAAEFPDGFGSRVEGNTALIYHGTRNDTVAAIGLVDAPRGARLRVIDNRYVIVELPRGTRANQFRVVLWRGATDDRARFARMLQGRTQMVDFSRGGPAHWPGTTTTRGVVAPDTSAYVVDQVTLPLPNQWRRNVRAADVDFFSDGRAAVATFEGDVWILSGLDDGLGRLEWKRFASGLYETMSVRLLDDEVYVYGREGIVRLHDLNGDGEADFYENFSNLSHQSIESREFPLSMDLSPAGGFYLSRGGALDAGPRTSDRIAPGFRAGSRHSGAVLEISPDGRSSSVFASGLREPFIASHPTLGLVSASDQQGNFVPTTPVHLLSSGGFYGVEPTAHRPLPAAADEPLVWIPHTVDRSGAGQAWVPGDPMGFGPDALIHMSYGKPGVFRVYADSSAGAMQGAVVTLLKGYTDPLLKGRYNPHDGHLYLTGFKVWDSNAQGVTAFNRIRYTGQPRSLPTGVHPGEQGVLLTFPTELDPSSLTDLSGFEASRWNYQRTSAYGSGNFRLDGEPGRDTLQVAAAHLSPDRKALLLVVPEMREVMQLTLGYRVRATDGRTLSDTLYLTVHRSAEMDLARVGLQNVDWRADLARAPATVARADQAVASVAAGAEISQRMGCTACHSLQLRADEASMGPPFLGLFGSARTFTDGTTRVADAAYLRQSILEPAAHVVQGYPNTMPSYLGVLSDTEIESLVLYIRSLGN
jgi:cytochrome c2